MENTTVELGAGAIEKIAGMARDAAAPPGRIDVFPAEGGIAGVVVPNTHTFKDLSVELDARLEKLAPGPRLLVAAEVAETQEGFIALVQRHGGTNTAIEALLTPSPSMKAFIDYHVPSNGEGPEARRLKHSVSYTFPYSIRMQAWFAAAGTWLPKRAFLTFVQERVADIVSPYEVEAAPGSVTRMEFEGVLRSRGKSREEREAAALETLFGTPEHLCNGAKAMGAISAEEFDEVEAGLGDVHISWKKSDKTTGSENVREFYLVEVAVFEGEQPQVLPARLKVKVENGALYMRLELLGLRTVIERSFAAACARVADETKRPVYRVKLA